MSVDVVIVNWNGRAHTLECLAGVVPQAKSHGAGVIVVDNGSTDGSVEAITASYPAVRIVRLPENRGFTGGVAAGVAASSADRVVLLNNDAIPEAGWLAALDAALENGPPDVIAVSGKIVDLSGRNIDFIGGFATWDGHAFQEAFRMPLGSRAEPAAGAELLFACGGNMIVRRREFVELGGFDDDYFAYLEDVDFGWRSWIAGHRIVFEPHAVVRHASSATSDRLGNFERGVLFERNALQTVLKNYGDELLRDTAGSILFAYLHRLHHYATERNPRATELRRPPFAAAPVALPSMKFLARVRRRLRRMLLGDEAAAPLAAIDDPLTTMQFRAWDWINSNSERLARKRADVQQLRKRSDREILERFPVAFVPTYPGDEALMSNPLFRLLRPDVPAVDRVLGDIMRR